MHVSMKKLFVFDWDGTLLDSIGSITQCKQDIAKKYGIDAPSLDQVRAVLGMSFEKAMAICFPTVSSSTLKKLCIDFKNNILTYNSKVFPWVVPLIESLKEEGVILAIASAKSSVNLVKSIKNNHLDSHFDLICSSQDYGDKPKKDMLDYIMRQFFISREHTIMIGDSGIDIAFANNAGVDSIAVTFGAHDEEKLREENPTFIAHNYHELYSQVKNLCP
jgi:phosphoglycolate phosphatase